MQAAVGGDSPDAIGGKCPQAGLRRLRDDYGSRDGDGANDRYGAADDQAAPGTSAPVWGFGRDGRRWPGPVRWWLYVECRVVGKHLLVEVLHRFARIDAEFVAQLPAQPVVAVQRLGLPSRPVQGEHLSLVQLLAQRVLCDQLVQLSDRRGVVAQGQLAVDLSFCRG